MFRWPTGHPTDVRASASLVRSCVQRTQVTRLLRAFAYQMFALPNNRQARLTTTFRAPLEPVYWPWRKLQIASSMPR